MAAKIFYDKDADLDLLKGKKIAILGYGSQGHGHAQNLRDSGCDVIVAELPGTDNHKQAVKDGFKPISAAVANTPAKVFIECVKVSCRCVLFPLERCREPGRCGRYGPVRRCRRAASFR